MTAQRGSQTGREPVDPNRVLTVPNLLSLLRLVLVPVFLWAILSHRDGLALAVLIVSGASDYLDGKLARTYQLVTKLGQILDPVADRLTILATLIGLALREVLPWWFLLALLLRDLLGSLVVQRVRRIGYRGLPVHFVGKAATFCLLAAFPTLLLGEWEGVTGAVAHPIGWALAWWGLSLYWVAFAMYVVQARLLLSADRATSPIAASPSTPDDPPNLPPT